MKNLLCTVIFLMYTLNSVHSFHLDVATMSIGEWYQEITYPTYENKKTYCEKHGYNFHFCVESKDLSRPIPWTKIKIIQELFEDPEVEWVFWTDADSLIMNSKIKLKSLIDRGYDIIVASDNNGINTGQFFIRNCEWSRDFLARIYAKEQFIYHGWWEQMSIIDEFNNNEIDRSHCKITKQRFMNSYPPEYIGGNHEYWHKGDFILHFAGHRGQQLVDLINKYSKIAR
jgi:hypothetical protein